MGYRMTHSLCSTVILCLIFGYGVSLSDGADSRPANAEYIPLEEPSDEDILDENPDVEDIIDQYFNGEYPGVGDVIGKDFPADFPNAEDDADDFLPSPANGEVIPDAQSFEKEFFVTLPLIGEPTGEDAPIDIPFREDGEYVGEFSTDEESSARSFGEDTIDEYGIGEDALEDFFDEDGIAEDGDDEDGIAEDGIAEGGIAEDGIAEDEPIKQPDGDDSLAEGPSNGTDTPDAQSFGGNVEKSRAAIKRWFENRSWLKKKPRPSNELQRRPSNEVIQRGRDSVCPKGEFIDQLCYYVSKKKAAGDEWNGVCDSVADIRDADANKQITKMLMKAKSPDVFLSLKRESPHKVWYWDSDKSIIAAQGCFVDRYDDYDLPVSVRLPQVNPELCIAACKTKGYKYAGVQAGSKCFCGNSYGRHGTKGRYRCDMTCHSRQKSALSKTCGGKGMNFIYAVDGLMYGSWAFAQPNYYRKNQFCAAVVKWTEYKFGDEYCGRRLQYMCHITAVAQAKRCFGNGYVNFGSVCLYLGGIPADWWTARRACQKRGGNLIKIGDDAMNNRVKMVIKRYGRTQKYWTGLTRLNGDGWKWKNGNSLSFSAWSSHAPNKPSENCAIMASRYNYQWDDVDCNRHYHYLCTSNPRATMKGAKTMHDPLGAQRSRAGADASSSNPLGQNADYKIAAIATTGILAVLVMLLAVGKLYRDKKLPCVRGCRREESVVLVEENSCAPVQNSNPDSAVPVQTHQEQAL